MALTRWAREDEIAILSLDRASKKNAVNLEMLEELDAHLDRATGDDSLRVLIVKGEGGCFCAGADIKNLASFSPESMRTFHDLRERVLGKLESLPCPTLSLIEGFALGTGLELALSTDFRVAAAGARFGIPSSRLGLTESHHYLTRLVRCAGLSRARFLVFTGENLTADEALGWGLVERVCPDAEVEERARHIARSIAGNAPAAVRASKKILAECDRDPYLESVADPGGSMAGSAGGEELREGAAAFSERRQARFAPPGGPGG